MRGLEAHLDATRQVTVFDAFERAATRVGLALFLVHVDAAQPTVVYASELLGEFVGRPVRELVGRPPWELVAAPQQARVRDIIATRGPGAPPITLEFTVERPDGSLREIEVGVARISSETAELAVCYFRDTTEQQQTIEALRRSEGQTRSLVETAPDGIVILQAGRIRLANPAALGLVGVSTLEAVRGRALTEFLDAEDAARATHRITRIAAGETFGSAEFRLVPTGRFVEVHSILYEYDDKPAIALSSEPRPETQIRAQSSGARARSRSMTRSGVTCGTARCARRS